MSTKRKRQTRPGIPPPWREERLDPSELNIIYQAKELTPSPLLLDMTQITRQQQLNTKYPENRFVRHCRRLMPTSRIPTKVDENGFLYREPISIWPPPMGMLTISMIQIVAFLVDWKAVQYDGHKMGPAYAFFAYDPKLRGQFWRFVTLMFVHRDLKHFLVNLLVQLYLGVGMELMNGSWRIAGVYVAGVLSGTLWTTVCNPEWHLYGGSGGVYAVIGLQILTIYCNFCDMEFGAVQLFAFVLFAILDIVYSLLFPQLFLDQLHRINYLGHVSGLTTGLMVGQSVLRYTSVQPATMLQWTREKKNAKAGLFLFGAALMASVVVHLVAEDYFPSA